MVQKRELFESKEFYHSEREQLNVYDIFFSYSYQDIDYAGMVVQLLEKQGLSVYIDYKDNRLDRDNVNRKTADTLAKAMNKCSCLLYMHSKSSKISKWCPWELGYMSGKKNFKCATIPIVDDNENYVHQEYLLMYPYIDYAKTSGTKNEFIFWVNDIENSNKYVELEDFIKGHTLVLHK